MADQGELVEDSHNQIHQLDLQGAQIKFLKGKFVYQQGGGEFDLTGKLKGEN